MIKKMSKSISENRVPNHHHIIIDGVRQKSLLCLDQPTVAYRDGKKLILPAGTVVAVNSGGMGSMNRLCWHAKDTSDDGQISIPVA